MSSLVAIAQAMEQEKRATASAPSTSTGATSKLSLVDIAKEQAPPQTKHVEKPLTLADVAKKIDTTTSEGVAKAVAPGIALHQLAQEINKEQRDQVDAAIASAAKQVNEEKTQERVQVLKTAVVEVGREEKLKAVNDAKPAKSLEASPPVAKSASPMPSTTFVPVKMEESDDDGGYSSFEEDEKATAKAKSKAKHTTKIKPSDLEDNQSEASKDDAPELTTASESADAKEFLRAVYRADLRRVKDMMAKDGFNASTADQHGWSALHWAVSQGHSEILGLLLHENVSVNAAEHVNRWTPLHLAIVRCSLPCVKKLLNAGAHIDVLDMYGDAVNDLARSHKGKKRERLLQILMHHRQRLRNK